MRSRQFLLASLREKSLARRRVDKDSLRIWTAGLFVRSFDKAILIRVGNRPGKPDLPTRGRPGIMTPDRDRSCNGRDRFELESDPVLTGSGSIKGHPRGIGMRSARSVKRDSCFLGLI